MELADTQILDVCVARRGGSSPSSATEINIERNITMAMGDYPPLMCNYIDRTQEISGLWREIKELKDAMKELTAQLKKNKPSIPEQTGPDLRIPIQPKTIPYEDG